MRHCSSYDHAARRGKVTVFGRRKLRREAMRVLRLLPGDRNATSLLEPLLEIAGQEVEPSVALIALLRVAIAVLEYKQRDSSYIELSGLVTSLSVAITPMLEPLELLERSIAEFGLELVRAFIDR